MFSKIWTKQSTKDSFSKIEQLKEKIETADTIIIGAGAGLSTSAGFTYTGERFTKYFSDFQKKYGFQDMYSGGFYPFDSFEEHWAYWSRYIYINRYMDAPKPVYEKLYDLVKEKDYFVLTTNVDHCFQKAGFDKHRLFYTQGDYGLFQCSVPCHQKTYDNEDLIRKMVEAQGFVVGTKNEFREMECVIDTTEEFQNTNESQKRIEKSTEVLHSQQMQQLKKEKELTLPEGITPQMAIPSKLVPVCPKCGKPMSMNLRADNTFVEDEGWHNAAERYSEFLRRHKHTKTVFLELGTGYNTPGIIKYNFWNMTDSWDDATYVCINLNEAAAPTEIEGKSICVGADIGEVLDELRN